jgi:hypothetical protein
VHVYHPDRVDRDDRTYYLQRMSRDARRGVVFALHSHSDPNLVRVYPKGLLPDATYTVRFQNTGFEASNTGAYWMTDGIGAADWGGDLVWLNVTTYPGAHTDKTPPSPPTGVARKAETYLGRSGISVTWTPGHDETWVSYHEVFKNGARVGLAPRAAFFFDPGATTGDVYEVRAVDGDGNASSRVAAQ